MIRPFHFAACGVAAIIAVALHSGAARADDASAAKDVFDALFSTKLKAVSASIDRADDIALAKEMLALAEKSTNQPALVALMCESAYDLGQRHADGYTTAADAMQLLTDTVESKQDAAREKLLSILTRQSAAGNPDDRQPAAERIVDLLVTMGDEKVEKKDYAGAVGDFRRAYLITQQKKLDADDEVKAKLEWAMGRDRAIKQIARLQEKLLADAKDHAAAEEIVKLYLIEMDDPAGSLPYVERMQDEGLKNLATLAAKPAGELDADSSLALGEWYYRLAQETKGARHLLTRSNAYLVRFLEQHTETDIQRTKAEVIQKEVQSKLALVKAPTPTDTRPKPPQSEAITWSMRLWGGSHFVPRALTNLDTSQEGDVFLATNPERINRKFVFLTNEQAAIPAEVDFELAVRVSGKGSVGLLNARGMQFGNWAHNIDSLQPLVIVVKRQSGRLAMAIDGKVTDPSIKGKQVGPNDPFVFAVMLRPNETIKIHDFAIKIAK